METHLACERGIKVVCTDFRDMIGLDINAGSRRLQDPEGCGKTEGGQKKMNSAVRFICSNLMEGMSSDLSKF